MEIKASDVKNLRDKTGAGMMDCKKALVEAGGDFSKAEKILKSLGLAAAAKRAGRATNEGRIFINENSQQGVVLELSCETDFVAKNDDFKTLGNSLCAKIIEKNISSIEDNELETSIKDTIGKIKENIMLKRFKVLEADNDELFSSYIHGEGRIGVLVKLKIADAALKDNETVKELAFNLALHVAAFAPLFISSADVPDNYKKEQEEIFQKQAQSLGKPENVLQGIVKGKLKKHFSEICFLDQNYVKDEKMKVQQTLDTIGKEVGSTISIVDFIYYRVGQE
ncbi:MAG: elongation factor Ts [Spirochaetales bacterium]|nr:elongation factor Ts [Spirochaetales bacterium]